MKLEILIVAVILSVIVRVGIWVARVDPYVAPDDFEGAAFWRMRRRVQMRRHRLRISQVHNSPLLSYIRNSISSLFGF